MDERQALKDVNAPLLEAKWLSTAHLPDYRGPSTRRYEPLPGPTHAIPFVQALREMAERWPDLAAVSGLDGVTTYGALWRSVQHLAAVIHDEHPGRGPIGLLLPAGALYVAAVFACLAVGRIAVPLDDGYPAGRNADICAATGMTLLLAGETSNPGLYLPCVAILKIGDVLRASYRSPFVVCPAVPFEAPAFILCTSGSTGQPKAIVHSQATMYHWARTTHNALHIRSDDRALSLSSLSSLGGFTSLLSYPLAGACQEMFDIKSQGISALFETLTGRPVTILRTAPSMLRSLCTLPEAPAAFENLRVVQTYGEPLTRADAAMVRRIVSPACLIRTTYGSTECSGFSWFAAPSDAHHPVYEPAGMLMLDTQAALVDDDGRPCAVGEAGELLIRSRYNALGEWIDGGLVPGRLQPASCDPETRIYHTGDIARVDADGVFVVLGRKDRMLKINGQRLEPAEIEAVLRAHGEVGRAEVIADLETSPARLIAFVVPAPDAGPDLARRLKTILRARLPSYMTPSRIVLLSAIPLLPGGKGDGRALLAGVFGGTDRTDQRS